MPGRHYCTYFDHRYLPRGMVMMDSIRKFAPSSVFHILALDDTCAEVLREMNDAGIEITTLAELEAADPDLLAIKPTRTLIEYYFTITPCFPRHVLRNHPEIDLLSYIDSDTCFFADPELIFAEIGDASVAITPHRFSPERLHLATFGLFNVGWITWRNDREGLACLETYRSDCIAWCYDRAEDDRFGDQKYLDRWPAHYPNLKCLDHPGINAAAWNINSHRISDVGDILFLGDKRLVFWHYHGLRETPDGWQHSFDDATLAAHPMLMERIYIPYIRRLTTADEILKVRHGLERETRVHIRYSTDRPTATGVPAPFTGWRAIGDAWPEAEAEGWTSGGIARIRRSQWANVAALPAFMLAGNSPEEQVNVLTALDAVNEALRLRPGSGPLRILDWGGDIGLFHHRLKRLSPELALDYTVKEMPFLCELGRELNPEVRFVDSEDAALAESYDLVIASAALHYEKDWRARFRSLCRAATGAFLFARQPTVGTAPSFVAQQGAYDTIFTCWVLNERDIFTQAAEAGAEIRRRAFSGDAAAIAGAAEAPVFRSYLLRPLT